MDSFASIRNHRYIVFGTDHFNLLGIIRTLGEEGIKPDVIVIGKKSILLSASKYVKSIIFVDDINSGIDYIVSNFGNDKLKPFILTGSDSTTSALNIRYDELNAKFHFFNSGGTIKLNEIMQKEKQYEIAEECGINYPKWEIVNNGQMPLKVKYPLITKSVNSFIDSWKENVHICNNDDELLIAYKSIKDKEIILQEYIDKKNELALQGISVNRGNEWYAPINIHFYRFYEDAYGNYFYYVPFNNYELRPKIDKFLKKIGYSGVFEMEFLIDKNDKLYFMETNFRHSCWNHSTASLGFKLSLEWAKAEVNGHNIDMDNIRLKKMPYKCMMEINEFMLNVVKYKKISFWNFLCDLASADYLFIWNRKDPKPFFNLLKSKIKRK